MTVRLLRPWNGYTVGSNITVDPATEASLVRSLDASTALTGSQAWQPNDPFDNNAPPYPYSGTVPPFNLIDLGDFAKWGVKADGRIATDGVALNGSNRITSVGIRFTEADIGKRIVITEPANATGSILAHASRITAIDGNTAICANTCGVDLTAALFCNVVVGSDDTAAIQAALDLAAPLGATVRLPAGIMMITSPLIVQGAVTLQGLGHDYGVLGLQPVLTPTIITAARGSVLMWGTITAGAGVVQLGASGSLFTSGFSAPRLMDVAVDGSNLATRAVLVAARRTRIYRCQIWRGTGSAIEITGQNTNVQNCVIGQSNNSSVVFVNVAPDVKLFLNEIRQGGTGHNITIVDGPNCQVIGNHIFKGFSGTIPNLIGSNIRANFTGSAFGLLICNNYLNGTFGHDILIETGAGATFRGITITGNEFAQTGAPGFTDNTYSAIALNPAASTNIRHITIMGNFAFNDTSPVVNYKAMVENIGAGGVTNCTVVGNTMAQCNRLFVGFTPDCGIHGNAVTRGTGTTPFRSSNQGQSVQNGTGAAVAFNIAHGLDAAPTNFRIGASTPASQALSTVTADATNIIVTFSVAPVLGTGNLVFNWDATL